MASVRLPLILALALLLTANASAFDGKRKGFVLGGGIGVTPYIYSSPETWNDNNHGLALHGLVGYAQNEHNLLALEGNLATQLFHGSHYLGVSWYRYFGRTGRSFFSAVGLGVYDFSESITFSEVENHEAGFGYMIGGGFEFAEHLQFAAYLTGGKTEFGTVDYTMNHLNITFSYFAF